LGIYVFPKKSWDKLFTWNFISPMGESMSVRVKVKSAESGSTVDMELEGDNTVNEIIESAAGYWGMSAGAYVLRKGKSLLRGGATVAEMGLINDDMVELIPDPEGGGSTEEK
jgi:hypothetical protein